MEHNDFGEACARAGDTVAAAPGKARVAGVALAFERPTSVLRPGQVFAGRFEIERLAGMGGMAAVYRARDRVADDFVALKIMRAQSFEVPPSSCSREQVACQATLPAALQRLDVERFLREAGLLARLDHPSIVRYRMHDATDLGDTFLVMEWLEGEDLAQRMLRAPLTVDESLLMMRRVCQAVAAAHAQGIVHRDIKPSNIFILGRDSSAIKLLDFGIAHI